MNGYEVWSIVGGSLFAAFALYFLLGAVMICRGRTRFFVLGREFNSRRELFIERKYLRYFTVAHLLFGIYFVILSVRAFLSIQTSALEIFPVLMFYSAHSFPEYSRRFRKDPTAQIEVRYSEWRQPLEEANDEHMRKRGLLIAGLMLAMPLIFLLIIILVY